MNSQRRRAKRFTRKSTDWTEEQHRRWLAENAIQAPLGRLIHVARKFVGQCGDASIAGGETQGER